MPVGVKGSWVRSAGRCFQTINGSRRSTASPSRSRRVEIDLPGVTRRASAPHLAVFEIDTRQVRVEQALALALEGGGIDDITIEDPPMEEVIREIYAQV